MQLLVELKWQQYVSICYLETEQKIFLILVIHLNTFKNVSVNHDHHNSYTKYIEIKFSKSHS